MNNENVGTVYGIHPYWGITAQPGFVCGIEYEIESISKPLPIVSGISVKEDGSLRNNGYEFVTEPASIATQRTILQELKKQLILGEDPHSERTSTHVHVNVTQLTMKQLYEFVLLYALFESVFFDFVGPERANSIFCVPLNYTTLPNNYRKGINFLISHWHKYTALNLTRVSDIGTVEFRHLYGTLDEGIIFSWLNLIRKLYKFVENNPEFSIKKYLYSGESIISLLETIFKTTRHGYVEHDFYQSSLDVRLAFVNNKE